MQSCQSEKQNAGTMAGRYGSQISHRPRRRHPEANIEKTLLVAHVFCLAGTAYLGLLEVNLTSLFLTGIAEWVALESIVEQGAAQWLYITAELEEAGSQR